MPKVPPAVAVQMPVGDLGPESPAHNVYWSVADGTKCKTLRNLWWLQLSKRQILTFLPNHWFGTERSEVRILSPRPLLLRKWTTRQSGLRICDVVVYITRPIYL